MTEKKNEKEAPKKERKPFQKPILKKDKDWHLKSNTSGLCGPCPHTGGGNNVCGGS